MEKSIIGYVSLYNNEGALRKFEGLKSL